MSLTDESFRWLDKIEYEKHKAVEAFDAELLKIFPLGSTVHFRYNDNQKNLSRGTVSKIYDGNIVVLREKPSRKGWCTCKRFWWRSIVSAEFLHAKAALAGKGESSTKYCGECANFGKGDCSDVSYHDAHAPNSCFTPKAARKKGAQS